MKYIQKNTIQNCPLCGSDEYYELEKADLVQCKDCSLVYLKKCADSNSLIKYYSSEFLDWAAAVDYWPGVKDEHIKEIEEGRETYFHAKAEEIFGEYLLPLLAEDIGSIRNLVEIGCAWGACMLPLKKRGVNVRGYEIAEKNCLLGRMLGLDIRFEDFIDADINKNSLDYVVMLHALEHIPQPLKLLEKIFSVLEPGGKILCAVPNWDSFSHIYDGNDWDWLVDEHVLHFNKHTLRTMLEKSGFEVLELYSINDKWKSPDRVKHLYADMKVQDNFLEELKKNFLGDVLVIKAQKPRAGNGISA